MSPLKPPPALRAQATTAVAKLLKDDRCTTFNCSLPAMPDVLSTMRDLLKKEHRCQHPGSYSYSKYMLYVGLFHPSHINELDFCGVYFCPSDILQLSSYTNLQYLRLCQEAYVVDVVKIRAHLKLVLPSLGKLREINFSGLAVDNELLHIVGTYLRNLRTLVIYEECGGISNSGLQAFCDEIGPSGCLESINICAHGMGWSDEVVYCLARLCPNLKLFTLKFNSHSIDTAACIRNSYFYNNQYLNLTELVCGLGTMVYVSRVCPNLKKVQLTWWERSDETSFVDIFSSLHFLKDVSLVGFRCSFEKVVPILEAIGVQLECLKLQSFAGCDISVIADLCPGLLKLAFTECSWVELTKHIVFRELFNFEIIKQKGIHLLSDKVASVCKAVILNCPKLSILHLHVLTFEPEFFSDEVYSKVKMGLTELYFSFCDIERKDQLIELLGCRESKLKTVGFCVSSHYPVVIAGLGAYIKEHNLDVTVNVLP